MSVGYPNQDESHFLDILKESAETGITPADEISTQYKIKWNKNINNIFKEFSY